MEKKCKDLVEDALASRMEDLRTLWKNWQEDPEKEDEELGNWNEYGLGFDYVPKGTFDGQKQGFYRYLLSFGGPQEEFRIYTDGIDPEVYRVEFWYLDWFDGAKKELEDNDRSLLNEIFLYLKGTGTVQAVYEKAIQNR